MAEVWSVSVSDSLEARAPFMYEVWNWVGDVSILPIKWHDHLCACDRQAGEHNFTGLTKEALISTYVRSPLFDPRGFFFLTYRSDVAGSLLVWREADQLWLRFLAVSPSHRSKDVGECLIKLGLNYAISLGFRSVCIAVKTEYERAVIQQLGFIRRATGSE